MSFTVGPSSTKRERHDTQQRLEYQLLLALTRDLEDQNNITLSGTWRLYIYVENCEESFACENNNQNKPDQANWNKTMEAKAVKTTSHFDTRCV